MSQKLDATAAYNFHDYLSGPHQHGSTSSLTTGNLIGTKLQSVRYTSGLGRWSWKRFRGRGDASIHIITLYRPVPPTSGGGPGSVYTKHLTHFSNLKIRECPRTAFLSDLSDNIITWKIKGDQIILLGDINKYVLRKKPGTLPQK